MNFDLTEDEQMLKLLAERFVSDRYSLDRRCTYRSEPAGFSAENWRILAEIGFVAIPYSGDTGAIGGSQVDMIVMFEALGRGLVVEPLIDAALGGGIFERGAPAALAAAWLPDLATGRRRIALAHAELAARDNIGWVETRAADHDGATRLTGEKAGVAHAVGADAFLVSAVRDGAVELHLVPSDAPGLRLTPYRQIDGSMAAKLELDGVAVPAGHRIEGGLDAIEDGEARARLARSAEAIGIMETMFAATLEYLRQRHQFGVALSSFQALRHRMAAQYVALEQARSLLYVAALAEPADRTDWLRSIAGAHAFIAEASLALGHEAIQLHGGMGVSDELMIGHAHKRLVLLSRSPTGPAGALDCYAGVSV